MCIENDYRVRFEKPRDPKIIRSRFFLHDEIAATLPACVGSDAYISSKIVEVDKSIYEYKDMIPLPKFPIRCMFPE